MARLFFASDYAYGINPDVPAATVTAGTTASGAGTLTVNSSQLELANGTIISPFATTAPVQVGNGAVQETQTPSAVSTTYPGGQTLITATSWTYAHGQGTLIASGTAGLQEALNDCAARTGGGSVIIDGRWTMFGGTAAMIKAATVPAGVSILDWRSTGSFGLPAVALSGSTDALAITDACYVVGTAGVDSMTLAAPTAAQEGTTIVVTSKTAQAHTIVATSLLATGGAASPYTTATFAAKIGAGLTLRATNLVWNLIASAGITFS